MLRPFFCVVLLLLASRLTAGETPRADFFVAPNGNDHWSGKLEQANADKTDGPLASVAQAQVLVRRLRAEQPNRNTSIVVLLRGGMYYLDAPITFRPDDSGTSSVPVVYQSYPNEQPVLSGGRPITGWKVDPQGRWQVTLDEVRRGAWSFAQLFVNDQRRLRPRLPKQGYFHLVEQVPATAKAAGKGQDRFRFAGEDLKADWSNLGEVEVLAFHHWCASRLPIASIDSKEHIVTFAGKTCTEAYWGSFLKGHRYLAINVREALSEPGEWYLDRKTGQLTYLPKPGEQPDRAIVVAPRLEQLLVFQGDPAGRRWVEHVHLRGLSLAHSNWTLPPGGQSIAQAEMYLSGAVSAVGARHLVLDSCVVRHTGQYGIVLAVGCQHNRIENCELVDLGAGGIKIGGVAEVPQDAEMAVSHQVIRNCLIAHGGRLHPAGIGVWIGHSPHNIVEHNEIADFYYSGISVGWIWGYAQSWAHHNDIGMNHIHTIGQRVLSDMGGVYTLGVSPGTRVHDNRIHDIQSHGYGGWGLYTDEGSTGVVMENNLVYRTKTGSYHHHYGRENRIQNNIFVDASEQQIQRTRTEEHLSFFFERNVVYWTNSSPLLGSNWKDNHFRMDRNLYFNARGTPVQFPGGLTLPQWQQNRQQDQHSRIADPKFVNAPGDDYHLQPNSPALELGFKPWDYTTAGRTSTSVLTADLPPVPAVFGSEP